MAISKKINGSSKILKFQSYPFADIYQFKDEYLTNLNTEPVLGKQK